MKLVITCPNNYRLEYQYIISVIMSDFMGLEYNIEFDVREGVSIKLQVDEYSKELVVEDIFFRTPQHHWLKFMSLPKQPLSLWDTNEINYDNYLKVVRNNIPVIYGRIINENAGLMDNHGYIAIYEHSIHLGLDVFGSSFFMLTRYEEYVKPDRDQYDRFPSTASLAYQEGFLDRPIINEYTEILWYCMKFLWPNLERKKRSFQIVLSHDIDQPYLYAFKPFTWLIRVIAGDLLKRKSIGKAVENTKRWLMVKRGKDENDPYNTFNFIMQLSEENNITSTFNFLTQKTKLFSCDYSLDDRRIKSLMRETNRRGHLIGYHGAYKSYKDEEQINKEVNQLIKVCEELHLNQTKFGGRQHYLQWSPQTWLFYDKAKLEYDSSLGFADHAGFRAGTCYAYDVFDVVNRQSLNLKEKPLIVMECSVLDRLYMGYSYEDAGNEIQKLKNLCKMYDGDFTLLWHNNRLLTLNDHVLLENIIKGQ